jgi:hypothetical protein
MLLSLASVRSLIQHILAARGVCIYRLTVNIMMYAASRLKQSATTVIYYQAAAEIFV